MATMPPDALTLVSGYPHPQDRFVNGHDESMQDTIRPSHRQRERIMGQLKQAMDNEQVYSNHQNDEYSLQSGAASMADSYSDFTTGIYQRAMAGAMSASGPLIPILPRCGLPDFTVAHGYPSQSPDEAYGATEDYSSFPDIGGPPCSFYHGHAPSSMYMPAPNPSLPSPYLMMEQAFGSKPSTIPQAAITRFDFNDSPNTPWNPPATDHRSHRHRRNDSEASLVSAASISDLNIEATRTETGVSPDQINRYIRTPVNNNDKWACLYPDCNKVFGRKENIKSHVQTHLGDRQYKCPTCEKCFVRQHDLKRHAKIHTGVRAYSCQCLNHFARHDALTRHRQRGMCIGAFEGVVRTNAKRGRPRKQRPDNNVARNQQDLSQSSTPNTPATECSDADARAHSVDICSLETLDLNKDAVKREMFNDNAARNQQLQSTAPMPTAELKSTAPMLGSFPFEHEAAYTYKAHVRSQRDSYASLKSLHDSGVLLASPETPTFISPKMLMLDESFDAMSPCGTFSEEPSPFTAASDSHEQIDAAVAICGNDMLPVMDNSTNGSDNIAKPGFARETFLSADLDLSIFMPDHNDFFDEDLF